MLLSCEASAMKPSWLISNGCKLVCLDPSFLEMSCILKYCNLSNSTLSFEIIMRQKVAAQRAKSLTLVWRADVLNVGVSNPVGFVVVAKKHRYASWKSVRLQAVPCLMIFVHESPPLQKQRRPLCHSWQTPSLLPNFLSHLLPHLALRGFDAMDKAFLSSLALLTAVAATKHTIAQLHNHKKNIACIVLSFSGSQNPSLHKIEG